MIRAEVERSIRESIARQRRWEENERGIVRERGSFFEVPQDAFLIGSLVASTAHRLTTTYLRDVPRTVPQFVRAPIQRVIR